MSVFSKVLSGLGSLKAGKASQKEFKTRAAAEIFEAGNEQINALRAENELTDELVRVISGQQIAFIAQNVDPSSPIAQTARAEAIELGEDEAARIRGEGVLRSRRRLARARALKRAGKSARLAGIIGAAGSFAEAGAASASGEGFFGSKTTVTQKNVPGGGP